MKSSNYEDYEQMSTEIINSKYNTIGVSRKTKNFLTKKRIILIIISLSLIILILYLIFRPSKKKSGENEKPKENNTLNDLDNQISKVEDDSKNLDSLIITQQELSKNFSVEDNLVNHIIKTFDDSFKKQIYDICSKNVREALNNNNGNKKTELKSQKKNKKDNNFMVVSGEREEFVSKGESNEQNETEENNKNESKVNNNPMMGGFNGQYMMYPYYFMQPGMNNMNMTMPNMANYPPNMKGNSFFYFPFPMPNMQQNNINKKK